MNLVSEYNYSEIREIEGIEEDISNACHDCAVRKFFR
jgi:hypothetical protein